jgi:DNA-binding NtrC family response regulator
MSDAAMPLDNFICADPGQEREGGGLQDMGYAGPAYRATCDRGDWALLGEGVAARKLRSQIQRIAPYFRKALIRGEAGTGKQAVGRAIHALSPAANGRFVSIDASALTDALDSGEAHGGSRSGLMEALETARGSTLYLMGVGELSLQRQAALYRIVRGAEECRGSPIAGMRILAESDGDLRMLVSMGQFRQDLQANFSAVEIMVPPLRRRAEDIPMLAAFLLQRIAREAGETPKMLGGSALLTLQQQPWPGNLRDLERVLAQAADMADRGVIEPCHIVAIGEEGPAAPALAAPVRMERLHDVVHRHVLDVLTRCGGNKLRAADALGISRSTLYRMLQANSACIDSRDESRKRYPAHVPATS